MDKEHYVVLPSNGCTTIHPSNSANKYVITWENPLEFSNQREWRVALTEVKFYYPNFSVTTNFGFEYGSIKYLGFKFQANLVVKSRTNISLQLTNPKIFPPSMYPTFDTWELPEISFDGQRFRITVNNFFRMKLMKPESANYLGITEEELSASAVASSQTYEHELVSTNNVTKWPPEGFVAPLIFSYTSRPLREVKRLYFQHNDRHTDEHRVAKTILDTFPMIFQQFQYIQNSNRFQFKLLDFISDITFLNGLNFALGFKEVQYFSKVMHNIPHVVGEFPPQLNRAVNNVYIYGSVCAPIRVGETLAPLLKSLWIDVNKRKYNIGEMYNVAIKNPMYLPLASSTINNVEINIRSDSGQLIPFLPGAVTTLTLHFKRRRNG